MMEAKRTRPWGTAGAWLICAGASAWVVGCGPKGPPPHVTEVPLAEFVPGDDPNARDAGAAGAGSGTSAAEAAPSEGPATTTKGHAAPTPLPADPNASAAPPSGGRQRPPPGQRLTARECRALVERCAVLTGVSKGMSMSQAMKNAPRLRAEGDQYCTAFQSSCPEYNSKSQMQCAMPSTTLDAFKACLQ